MIGSRSAQLVVEYGHSAHSMVYYYFIYCGAVLVDGVPTPVTPWMDIWAWEVLHTEIRQQTAFTIRLRKTISLP